MGTLLTLPRIIAMNDILHFALRRIKRVSKDGKEPVITREDIE